MRTCEGVGQDIFVEHRKTIVEESKHFFAAVHIVRNAHHDANPLRRLLVKKPEPPRYRILDLLADYASEDAQTKVRDAVAELEKDGADMEPMRDMLMHYLSEDTNRVRAQDFPIPAGGQQEQANTVLCQKEYLLAVALLVYFSRKTIQVCTLALKAWRPACNNKKLSGEEGGLVWRQAVAVAQALSSAQTVWNKILKAPWSLACCLHFFPARLRPSVESLGINQKASPQPPMGLTQGNAECGHNHAITIPGADHSNIVHGQDARTMLDNDDGGDVGNTEPPGGEDEDEFDLDLEVPDHVEAILDGLSDCCVRVMVEQSFRLASITRRQHEAEDYISEIIMANKAGGDPSATFSLEFVRYEPNSDERDYTRSELISLVADYWKAMAESKGSTEGLGYLSEIANTDVFRDDRIGLPRSIPQAHAECILAVDAYRKHGVCLPTIGVSRPACGGCTEFIRGMINSVYPSPRPTIEDVVLLVRSEAFWPWSIPSGTPGTAATEMAKALRQAVVKKVQNGIIIDALRCHRDFAIENNVFRIDPPPGTPGSNKADSEAGSSPPDITHLMVQPPEQKPDSQLKSLRSSTQRGA